MSQDELVARVEQLGISTETNDIAKTLNPAAIAARVAFKKDVARQAVEEPADSGEAGVASRSQSSRATTDVQGHDGPPSSSDAAAKHEELSMLNRASPAGEDHQQVPVRDAAPRDDEFPGSEQPQDRHDSSQPPEAPDDVTQTTAAPVVHETVHVQNHEIRHEVIDREIHEYHEVKHILPVVEREVLPARHFVLDSNGEKVEIAPPVPGMPITVLSEEDQSQSASAA